jgi:phosphonate transport system ATP-binding protein
MPASLVQIQNQNLGYANAGSNTHVLNKVNFTLSEGEQVVLMGASGSGKTTLLKHLRNQLKEVAWCPQELGLVDSLSVFHNIYSGQLNQHWWGYNLLNLIWPRPAQIHKVSELCEQLNITEHLFNSIPQLSGGQKQRVALARAFHHQQPIFLGDEPTSALDEVQAQNALQRISHRHHTAVITLHDFSLARRFATRIIGIKSSAIAFDLAVNEVDETMVEGLYQ